MKEEIEQSYNQGYEKGQEYRDRLEKWINRIKVTAIIVILTVVALALVSYYIFQVKWG